MRFEHVFVLLAAVSLAGCAALDEMVPIAPEEKQCPPPSHTQYRGKHTFLIYVAHPRPVDIALRCIQVGQYDSSVCYSVSAPDGTELCSGEVEFGKESKVMIDATTAGVHRLVTSAGRNAYTVNTTSQYLGVEASSPSPVHVIGRCEKLFFFVPAGTRCFSVSTRGAGARETVKVSVFDGEDKPVAEGSTVKTGFAGLLISVPEGKDGSVWSLLLSKAEEGMFEDAEFWLGGLIPPYISANRNGIVLPFFHFRGRPPTFLPPPYDRLPITLNLLPKQLAGCSLAAELSEARSGNIIVRQHFRHLASRPPELRMDEPLQNGAYSLRLRLMKEGREHRTSGDVYVVDGLVFYGVVPQIARVAVLDGEPARFMLYPNVELPKHAGLRGVLVLKNESAGRVQREVLLRDLSRRQIPVTHENGLITFTLELRYGEKTIFRQTVGAIYIRDKVIYAERQPVPAKGLPWRVLMQDKTFLSFVPPNVDAIAYNFLPNQDDVTRPMRSFGAPDQYVSLTFGVYCSQPLKDVCVTVGDLASGVGNKIVGSHVEVKKALYWPQRTSWRSKDFYIIPEMLEPFSSIDLEPYMVHQFWLTLHIPRNAVADEYSGAVAVASGSKTLARIPIHVKVLPFALEHPPNKVWGLYSDSQRWPEYPDTRVRAELQDIKAHGIDTMVMYPLKHAEITYENGHLKVDLAAFRKYMRMYMEAGLGGPVCMSFQGLDSLTRGLVGTKQLDFSEESKKVFLGILAAVRKCGEEEKWPPAVYHFIDEPNMRDDTRAQSALMMLKLAKDAGYTTFTTVLDPALANDVLDPYLDVRCYSSGWSVVSAERHEQARTDCLHSQDTFWWYGSGSYTGQEGNIICNRLLCGYVFVKSGATGQWSWTFQRPKESPFDDFDGLGAKQSKDACTTYAARDGSGLCITLQWEGVREGITDAKYVFTLEEAIRRAKQSPSGSLRRKAARAEKELQALMEKVPWSGGRRDVQLTTAQCDEMRRQIAEMIELLSRSS